jgi:hypothetical protein
MLEKETGFVFILSHVVLDAYDTNRDSQAP